jgi:hypothetical protein
MTLRLSSGLRDAILDYKARATDLMTATTISFGDGDGTGGNDTINDSDDGLGGFSVGDMITVSGSTSNDGVYEILAVAAGIIQIPAGSLSTEAAGDTVVLAAARGGSIADLMKYGKIDIYSGTQPTSADDAETGTKLASITQSSGAFTSGVETNGLVMGNVTSHALKRETGEVWSGTAVATGTAGWFRFYANTVVTGASTEAIRFDGAIATSGAQLNMSNTAVTSGGTTTIDSVALTQPGA